MQTIQPTIQNARTIVTEEITILRRERKAFEQFIARVETIETSPEQAVGCRSGPTLHPIGRTTAAGTLQSVKQAFRETVMAVPHYDENYGDSLREGLAADLGAPLAREIADGQHLTPRLYDAVLTAGKRARNDRAEFLPALRREHESLREIETELEDIEGRVFELGERISRAQRSCEASHIDDSLATLENRCSDLADRRQATIHERGGKTLSSAKSPYPRASSPVDGVPMRRSYTVVSGSSVEVWVPIGELLTP